MTEEVRPLRVLTALESLFALAIVAGVALSLGVGVALVVGGVLGVVSCEWNAARARSERRTG